MGIFTVLHNYVWSIDCIYNPVKDHENGGKFTIATVDLVSVYALRHAHFGRKSCY